MENNLFYKSFCSKFYMIPDDNSSFAELNNYIMDLIGRFGSDNLDLVLRYPIYKSKIHDLKKVWELSTMPLEFPFDEGKGLTNFDTKTINISDYVQGYERDKAICHELVHANYGKSLNDLFRGVEGEKNNAIVEWYARHVRASPELLSEIWRDFNISPKIYDKSSFLATQKLIKPQLLFPSLERDYNFTLMD